MSENRTTEAAPPAQEETDGPEEPANGGDAGVSIDIPGLPVGTGRTVDLGGSWCGVFSWGESLPVGVRLEITAAVAVTENATILDQPCEGSPPCPGTTISVDAPEQGCGITVVPPSPDIGLVLVRLEGVLHCPDLVTCEELVPSSESTAALENPNGDSGTPGSDTDGATADPGGG